MKAWSASRNDCLLVDQDECWFSRFAQPQMHAWAESGGEMRLVERTPTRNDNEKAIACYGAVDAATQQRYLLWAEGQPNSTMTIEFLERMLAVARQLGKRLLAVIWDRASWHKSAQLRQWLYTHNQSAKRNGDVRLLTCLLPIQSPWLNPMEPFWIHAKRKAVEPNGDLTISELKRRVNTLIDVDLASIKIQASA